jgi:hypothetical protein
MKKIILLVTSIALLNLTACATAKKLEMVPTINTNNLPMINTTRMKPKAVMIEVTNLREVNQTAGNAAQVAASVSDALTEVAEKSGLSIGKSTNLIRVELQDCPPMKNSAGDSVKNSVCLKVKLNLMAGALQYEGSATSENYGWNQTGNINDAYQSALKTVLDGMNKKLAE